jgi:hypothetical protein
MRQENAPPADCHTATVPALSSSALIGIRFPAAVTAQISRCPQRHTFFISHIRSR